jgi:hypothetical protein
MRIYNVSVLLRDYPSAPEETVKVTIILGKDDSLSDYIYMIYGTWHDVVGFEYEDANLIHISKSFIAEEAMKLIRFD